MIELGSILQIPLCIILVTDMDKAESSSYSSSNNQYVVDEQITQANLPPEIQMKISNVPLDSTTWHTDNLKADTSATSCKIFQTLYLYLI